MTSSVHVGYRRLVGLAAGLALATAAVPAAGGQTTIPGDLSGRQYGPSALALVVPADLAGRQYGPTSSGGDVPIVPSDLSGRQFGPTTSPSVQIPADLAGRDFGPTSAGAPVAVPSSADGGLDLRDVGVGAALGALASIALVGMAFLLGRRRGRLAGA